MAITREQILAEIKKRQTAKAKTENKTAPARKAVRRPVPSPSNLDTPFVVNERRNFRGETLNEMFRRKTAGMSEEKRRQYKTLVENIEKATKAMYSEATQAGPNVAGATMNAAGVGLMKTYFDIFFGYHPHLIVHDIASVQPMDKERSVIFYYQSIAGSTKGKVTAGDVLLDPFKVNTDPEYTSNEVSIAVGAEVDLWGPYIARSVRVKGFDVVYSSDTAFTFTHNGNTITGTITEGSGKIKVELSGTGATDITHVVYEYDNKYAPTETPDLNANVATIDVTAKARTIKTQYSFQAGFGFEAQFGKTLEETLAEQAMYQLKRETDLDFVFEIMNRAPELVKWNKAAGVAQGLYEFHKLSFLDAVIHASNRIFAKSKRARGNVLLVGINAQTIVETLPAFKGENYGSQLGGGKVIGTLKDIKVIAVPELDANDWAVIYKSSTDNLDAGIVFAPYIPVVATPTVMLDDFLARKGYTTSYGKVVVNPDYFVRGTIINDPIAQPIVILDKSGEIIEDFGNEAA